MSASKEQTSIASRKKASEKKKGAINSIQCKENREDHDSGNKKKEVLGGEKEEVCYPRN